MAYPKHPPLQIQILGQPHHCDSDSIIRSYAKGVHNHPGLSNAPWSLRWRWELAEIWYLQTVEPMFSSVCTQLERFVPLLWIKAALCITPHMLVMLGAFPDWCSMFRRLKLQTGVFSPLLAVFDRFLGDRGASHPIPRCYMCKTVQTFGGFPWHALTLIS